MAGNDEKSVVIDVRAESDQLEADLDKANRKVRRAAEESARAQEQTSGEVTKKHKEDAEKRRRQAEELGRHVKETEESVGKHAQKTGDSIVKKHGEDVEKLKKQTDGYKEKAVSAAKDIGKAVAGIGAAMTAASAAAITSAAKDQTAFAKVKTLLSAETNPETYADTIKAAVKETGVRFGDLSESVYSAISASVDEKSAVAFTANAVKLAKGGFTDAATSVDVLTTAINAYSLSAEDASHISDVLITAQNEGKTTVNELASSMGQTIPIANGAGAAIEDLAAQYAVLTKNGVATAEAGTGIKAMLSELNSAKSTISKTLKEISGKSFSELQAEGKSTADILNLLAQYAASSGKKLSDLFGSVEAGSAALTIVKDGGADFNRILSKMENSADATEKAYEIMSNTVEERFEKLKNRFLLGVSEIGEKILPYVEEFFDYVDEHSGEFESALEDAGEFLLEFSKALGEVVKIGWEFRDVLLIAGAAIGGWKLGQAISGILSLTTAIGGASGAMTTLNAVFAANPIGLIVTAAAAGVAVLVVLNQKLSEVSKVGERAAQKAKDLTVQVENLNSAAENTRDGVKSLQTLIDKYTEVSQSEADDAEKKRQLAEVQSDLNLLYEDEARRIDLVNGKYDENIEKLENLSETKRAYMRNQAKEALELSEQAIAEAGNYQSMSSADGRNQWIFDYTDAGENAAEDMENILKKAAEKYGGYGVITSREAGTGSINANFEAVNDLEAQAALIEEILNEMAEKGLSDIFSENYNELYDILEEKRSAIQSHADAQEQYNRLCGDTAESLSEEAEAERKAADSADRLSDSTDGVTGSFDEERIAISDLNDFREQLLTDYKELYELLGKVQNGETLTYEEIQKLIAVYPALLEHISLTSDGCVIEKNAVGDLNAALDDSVEVQINAEREKTLAAIDGAKERITLYQKEAEALARLMAAHGGGTAEERSRMDSLAADISEEDAYLNDLYAQLKKSDTLNISDYLKNATKPSDIASGGTTSQKGTTKKTDPEPTETEKNAEEYAKKKKDLDYQRSMDEISDDNYYKKLGEYRDTYLEKDSDAWRSANVDIHNHEKTKKEAAEKEKNKKNTKKSSGAAKGTVINIDSYIPTLWDDEEESNRKLQEALGIELAGNSQTGKKLSIELSDSFTEATSSSPSSSAVSLAESTAQTTLADVLKELRELKESDVKRKISLDVDLYARDLMVGRIAIPDINEIAKQTGRSPFEFN